LGHPHRVFIAAKVLHKPCISNDLAPYSLEHQRPATDPWRLMGDSYRFVAESVTNAPNSNHYIAFIRSTRGFADFELRKFS